MKRIVMIIMGLISLCLILTGCDGSTTPDDITDELVDSETGVGSKNGERHFGYFIQEDVIMGTSGGVYSSTTYDPLELEVVCMDPVCTHSEGSSCSALPNTYDGDISMMKVLSVTYKGKLILIDSYIEYVDDKAVYKTDVYEAKLDGSNRRKVLSFEGNTDGAAFMNDMVMVDGKLYCGGNVTETWEQEGEDDLPSLVQSHTYGFFCIDLNNYTVTKLLEEDGGIGICNLYAYDGYVYIARKGGGSYDLYKVDIQTNKCEKVLETTTDVIFCGAIEDTIYYVYMNEDIETIYSRQVGSDEETVFVKDAFHAVVMDKQLYVLENNMTDTYCKYSIYDKDGNVTGALEYDKYMYLCGDIGDRVLYYTITKVGMVDKEHLEDVFTKGQEIGSP